ncbi:trans-1,2-dihydrobenzene-1,2-diol dehydrogenase [Dendroctonus ponderosae]
MALRWGIASAGNISSDFVQALKGLPPGEHRVVAVAARALQRAQEFAGRHDVDRPYEDYRALAQDPDVQVVYVGAVNSQHFEVATLMLQHGKHVLCEKPLALNERQARRMVELARSRNLFLMEGIWSRFFPVYRRVRQLLDASAVGEPRFVSTAFGDRLEDLDRVKRKELGGGATLTLGVYMLQLQQLVFGNLQPLKVAVAGHTNEEGVDVAAAATFTYPGQKIAVLSCNASLEMPNEALIIGTTGAIRIPDFWCPTSFSLNGEVRKMPLLDNQGPFNYQNSAGLAYEAAEVRRSILAGEIESPQMTHKESIQLAGWMDLIRKELGVKFRCDFEDWDSSELN